MENLCTRPASRLLKGLVGVLCFCGSLASAQHSLAPDVAPGARSAQPTNKTGAAPVRRFNLATKQWKGDFDAMLEHRVIHVLVPYSRTLYFSERGHERGLAADLVREFEQYLNRKYAS